MWYCFWLLTRLKVGSTPAGRTNMDITGITLDGKITIGNIGKFYFQKGIPLNIIFDCLIENDIVVDWISLKDELINNGMSLNRIKHLLSENINDSYGKKYRDHVINKLGL